MPYIGNQHNVGDHINNFKVLDDISSYTETFDGSAASVISTADETIRIPEHRFIQGQRVTYTNGGGGNIGGLTSGTAYFVSFDSANTIKLATTLANANSNTVINISTVGSGTSHTLNAAFDGVNTKFKVTYRSGKAARFNNATQLNVAINNVIQRPNQSALSFTEGFAIEDNHKIVFKVAPTVNDIFWGSIIANTIENFDLRDNEVDNFTGDGSTTEFTLSTIPANNESVIVSLDGVLQHPSDKDTARAYTLLDSIIQFTAAPSNGVEIQVRHIGFAGATTNDVSGFYGRTGNVTLTSNDHITTGDITSRNINASGILTASSANFSGNVSIGGTLTYEDVTNIDSVGVITARDGIKVGTGVTIESNGNSNFVGVSSLGTGATGAVYLYNPDADALSGTTNDIYGWKAKTYANGLQVNSVLYLSRSGSNGLQLQYNNATGSYITAFSGFMNINVAYGGAMQLDANDVYVRNRNNTETFARFSKDHTKTVSLYSNNVLKFTTEDSGVNVVGTTTSTQLAITGVSTFTGAIDANGDLDVDGHTNLDNVSIAGVTTTTGNIHLNSTDKKIYLTSDYDQYITANAASNYMVFAAGNQERLRIDSSGRTLIGTSTQNNNARLQVTTDQQVVATFEGTGVSDPQIYVGDNMASPTDNVLVIGYDKADNRGYLTVGGDADTTFSIANGNKVGINQVSPRTSLDVTGYIYSNSGSQIQITGSPGAKGLQLIGQDDGTSLIGTMGSSGEHLLFRTASSERMRLLVGGPHLLLGGTSSVNDITETSSHSGLVIGNTSMGNGGLAIINSTTGAGRIYFGDSVGGNSARNRGQIVYYHSSDHMHFATAGSERLRIDSSGRVMIGNTNASTMFGGADDLVVGNTSGAHGITIITSNSTVGRLLFSDSTSSGAATYQGQINFNHSTDELDLRTYTGGSITFATGNTEKLRINSSGHISLGGSNVTDVNMITVNGSGASQNVGIVFNKTNSPARAYGINVNNTSGDLIFFDYTANSERLRITSDGQITTRGATATGFNNLGNNDFGSYFTIYGGHTINECGVLSLEGNTNTGGQPLGHIQFINRANANGSSGGNVQTRLGAKIVSYAETTDSNAGDDSGAVLSFTTKKEAAVPSEKLRIFGDGRIGIGDGGMNGCKASVGGLDVSSGKLSIIMGGETNVGDGTGRRNGYQKEARLGMPHYTNAEEPFGLVYGVTISGENRLNLGGGSSIINAATQLSLYTAVNNTTAAGTEQIRMTGEGIWRVGKLTSIAEGNPTEMPRVSSSRGYTSIGRDGYSSIIRRMGAYRGSISGMKLFSIGSNGAQTWARIVVSTILGTPSFGVCRQEFLYAGNKSLRASNYSGNDYTSVVTLAWSGTELQFSCNNANYYSTIECELGSPNDTTSNGWYPTWGTSW